MGGGTRVQCRDAGGRAAAAHPQPGDGAGEWPQAEYGPLLDLAETVRLEHHETFWTGYSRKSQQAGQYEVEGFIGQAWYAGDDLRPLLPVLWLGQWLHIGKGYVIGNGRYTAGA